MYIINYSPLVAINVLFLPHHYHFMPIYAIR